ncbi:hypothetical protein, partial [[Ruminococcus] torques]|uniref:hypothetical protein n=2 Tax=[Ruminococcus] torques TaxID=33039 RepID=UPI0022E273DE
KKFSRVVVYCSVIKVLSLFCLKRQLLYSIKSFIVCQELFIFLLTVQATALIDYHIAVILSTTFFTF